MSIMPGMPKGFTDRTLYHVPDYATLEPYVRGLKSKYTLAQLAEEYERYIKHILTSGDPAERARAMDKLSWAEDRLKEALEGGRLIKTGKKAGQISQGFREPINYWTGQIKDLKEELDKATKKAVIKELKEKIDHASKKLEEAKANFAAKELEHEMINLFKGPLERYYGDTKRVKYWEPGDPKVDANGILVSEPIPAHSADDKARRVVPQEDIAPSPVSKREAAVRAIDEEMAELNARSRNVNAARKRIKGHKYVLNGTEYTFEQLREMSGADKKWKKGMELEEADSWRNWQEFKRGIFNWLDTVRGADRAAASDEWARFTNDMDDYTALSESGSYLYFRARELQRELNGHLTDDFTETGDMTSEYTDEEKALVNSLFGEMQQDAPPQDDESPASDTPTVESVLGPDGTIDRSKLSEEADIAYSRMINKEGYDPVKDKDKILDMLVEDGYLSASSPSPPPASSVDPSKDFKGWLSGTIADTYEGFLGSKIYNDAIKAGKTPEEAKQAVFDEAPEVKALYDRVVSSIVPSAPLAEVPETETPMSPYQKLYDRMNRWLSMPPERLEKLPPEAREGLEILRAYHALAERGLKGEDIPMEIFENMGEPSQEHMTKYGIRPLEVAKLKKVPLTPAPAPDTPSQEPGIARRPIVAPIKNERVLSDLIFDYINGGQKDLSKLKGHEAELEAYRDEIQRKITDKDTPVAARKVLIRKNSNILAVLDDLKKAQGAPAQEVPQEVPQEVITPQQTAEVPGPEERVPPKTYRDLVAQALEDKRERALKMAKGYKPTDEEMALMRIPLLKIQKLYDAGKVAEADGIMSIFTQKNPDGSMNLTTSGVGSLIDPKALEAHIDTLMPQPTQETPTQEMPQAEEGPKTQEAPAQEAQQPDYEAIINKLIELKEPAKDKWLHGDLLDEDDFTDEEKLYLSAPLERIQELYDQGYMNTADEAARMLLKAGPDGNLQINPDGIKDAQKFIEQKAYERRTKDAKVVPEDDKCHGTLPLKDYFYELYKQHTSGQKSTLNDKLASLPMDKIKSLYESPNKKGAILADELMRGIATLDDEGKVTGINMGVDPMNFALRDPNTGVEKGSTAELLDTYFDEYTKPEQKERRQVKTKKTSNKAKAKKDKSFVSPITMKRDGTAPIIETDKKLKKDIDGKPKRRVSKKKDASAEPRPDIDAAIKERQA